MATDNLHEELPPHYTDAPETLPLAFPVGVHDVAPLVNMTDIQAHLRILSSFKKLKDDVHNAQLYLREDGTTQYTMDKDRAWVVFVNRAVYRFDQFMSGKWTADYPRWSEGCIPPLDVVMVWHTYLLNPRMYYEDSVRRTTPFARRLAAMESMPLTLIASLIDSTTFEPLLPSAQRESFFETTSGLPYMYSLTTSLSDIVSLNCPCCNTANPTIPWITSQGSVGGTGTGFAEPSFVHECEWCNRKFTRPMMGIRKFCEEVTRRRARRKVFFAETLLQPKTGKADEMLADMFTIRLLRRLNAVFDLNKPCEQDKITEEAIDLARRLDWSLQELSVYLHLGLWPRKTFHVYNSPPPRMQRILAAYSTPGYASLDLVAAVLRQEAFVGKMEGLGWLQENSFQLVRQQGALLRAIARYHAFLDLMSTTSSSFLIPTLDIDLVWHTHQLSGAAYRADTMRLLNRVPNHDDTVVPLVLQSAYDRTSSAWKARFGVAYSLCGCMPDQPHTTPNLKPKPPTSSDSKGIKRFKLFKATSPPKYPSPATPTTQTRSNITSKDLADADASHPSDHNMHLEKPDATQIHSDLVSRDLASKERVVSIRRDLERVSSGMTTGSSSQEASVDSWRKLQAERRGSRTDHKEAFTSKEGYYATYYPYWGVSVNVPVGFYGAVKHEDAIGGCGSGCSSCGDGVALCMG